MPGAVRVRAPAHDQTRMSYFSTLLDRLRTAGVEPSDSEDLKLKKQLLMFAMGLTVAAPVLWFAIYGYMGQSLTASVPF